MQNPINLTMNLIEVSNISKSYKDSKVLSGVSLEVMENEVFGFLGPNGAGKSTLAKILCGYYSRDGGTIKVFGSDFDTYKNDIIRRIGIVPQEEQFYRDFSVRENIEFFGSLYGFGGTVLEESTENLLVWLNLKRFEKMPAKNLSGGYRRLLNIACSLAHNPEIVYMDEPTVGLDPTMRKIFWDKIKELKEMGKTICITTHYMDEAEHLCDRLALIVKGKVLVVGKPRELIRKHGGEMTLKLELPSKAPLQVVTEIKEIFPLAVVVEKEKSTSITVKSSFDAKEFSKISRILSRIPQEGLFFDLHEPTLEDVFFNLTGEKQEVNKVEYSSVHTKGN